MWPMDGHSQAGSLIQAVGKRAALLPEEYRLKAATADTDHNGVEEGVVGQCEQKIGYCWKSEKI